MKFILIVAGAAVAVAGIIIAVLFVFSRGSSTADLQHDAREIGKIIRADAAYHQATAHVVNGSVLLGDTPLSAGARNDMGRYTKGRTLTYVEGDPGKVVLHEGDHACSVDLADYTADPVCS